MRKKNGYIFFGCFPVEEMEKKNMCEKLIKKKGHSKNWKWATAHLSHDIMYCIVTQRLEGWPGQGEEPCHDTNFVSWLGWLE